MEPTRAEQGARETGPFCPELLDQQSQASGCWAVENWTQFWVGGLQVTLQKGLFGRGALWSHPRSSHSALPEFL